MKQRGSSIPCPMGMVPLRITVGLDPSGNPIERFEPLIDETRLGG